ncbi:hypothetical protein ACVRYP_07845 [Streptococcus rifensis]
MTAIYWLMVKKRWYVFLAIFVTGFLMNLIVWNETSQLIRNLVSLKTMQVEAENDGYDLVYYPSQDQTQDNPQQAKDQLYQKLTELNEQGKVFYNKGAYLNGGDLLPLDDEILTKEFSESQVFGVFFNDLLFRKLSDEEIDDLETSFLKLGDKIEIVPFQKQYEKQQDYYWNNMIFGLGVGTFLLVIGLLLLRWLLLSTWRICEEEIKVLRLIGLSKRRLGRSMTLFLHSPIILALLVFIFSSYTIFYFGMIGWDYIYLIAMSSLQFLLISYMVSRRMKGETDA